MPPAAGPEQHCGCDICSWRVMMNADNRILIKAIVYQSIFRSLQNIIHLELLFLAWIVAGRDLSGAPT